MDNQNVETNQTGFELAQKAVGDAPLFVEHIQNLFTASLDHFKAGNDLDGMSVFARGVNDLGQFIELMKQLSMMSGNAVPEITKDFEEELYTCIYDMEEALKCQDIISLSDGIEATLLPLLPRWGETVDKFRDHFKA